MKRRFVQVGLGGRAALFRQAITKPFADRAELLALCDRNAGRVALSRWTWPGTRA
jgi:hypothetical protein